MFFGNVAVAIGLMTKALWAARTGMLAFNSATKKNIIFASAAAVAFGISLIINKLRELRGEQEKLIDLEDGAEVFSRERLDKIQEKWAKEKLEKEKKLLEDRNKMYEAAEMDKFNRILKQGKLKEAREKEMREKGVKLLKKDTEDTLAILSTSSRRAFKAFKAWKIQEAIIDAIGSFNKALNSGYPPPLNFALAASSIALGYAKVSAIRATTYSGRAEGGPVSSEKAYRVGERGPEMFVPGQSGYILPNQDGKTVNVNFNINAVDARGFQQLLANERGMIVSMINSAVNQQGRSNII